MRNTLVAFGLGLSSLCALAEDAPKAAAPAVVSSEQWATELQTALGDGVMTPDRVARLKELAASKVIECKGKIRDIVKDVDGEKPAEIATCDVYGTHDLRRFIVADTDVEIARPWRRWDRLTWRERARVTSTGEVLYEWASARLADCVRTPNPGFEPRPATKPTADNRAYLEWIGDFAKFAYAENMPRADAAWKRGVATTWIFPATVSSRTGVNPCTVRLAADGYVDASKPVRVGTSREGKPIMETRVVGHWGFGVNDDLPLVVEDAQAAALLTGGARIEVAIDLDPDACGDAVTGRFHAALRPWKIRGKK